jgi:hypothetical protein
MNTKRIITIAALALLVSGCVQTMPYRPTYGYYQPMDPYLQMGLMMMQPKPPKPRTSWTVTAMGPPNMRTYQVW